MNILKFSVFNYINIALSLIFIILLFVFKNKNLQLIISIIPLLLIFSGAYIIQSKSKISKDTLKNLLVGNFIGAILVAFAPYILQFGTNKSLLFSSLIFTILILINIFLVNTEPDTK
jgi:uncharacterized membrane protein